MGIEKPPKVTSWGAFRVREMVLSNHSATHSIAYSVAYMQAKPVGFEAVDVADKKIYVAKLYVVSFYRIGLGVAVWHSVERQGNVIILGAVRGVGFVQGYWF